MGDNQPMAAPGIELTVPELREITAFALACAEPALSTFERDLPGDSGPREALAEARCFAGGGRRTQALRVTALEAHRAARRAAEQGHAAAGDAARAAGHAAASAYLHPLARADQVIHILGAAVHAARALELDAGGDPDVGAGFISRAVELARPTVVDVLGRYPLAPARRGRIGELMRELDSALRRPER